MNEIISKKVQLYDESKQVWFDVYRAHGVEGHWVLAEVPREDQSPSAVKRHLLRNGADIDAVEETRLVAAIATDAPVMRRAAHTGWRDSNATFVSLRYVAGAGATDRVMPPQNSFVGTTDQLGVRGTLEQWRDLVSVARHSTSMTVALCAPFAAPLLGLVQRPSFAIVLVGPSRSGKSTSQLVGASVLGFGQEEHLPSLNATHAGLLAAALGFNDHMLPINEVGTARGPKSEIYVSLRNTTYSLVNGSDVLRHPSWTGGGAGTGSFQVICLLSSELSPDGWAARNGEVRDEGETARLIGFPVVWPGRSTIFDRPPPKPTRESLVLWEAEQFRRLRQGLQEHRGVAFTAYLDVLLGDVPAHAARARRLVGAFERNVTTSSMSPVARDIVGKFGVLFAGGVLAVEAGVLPLERKEIGPAVRRACLAALQELPDPEGELRADLTLLKDRLAGASVLDLETCTRKEMRLMRNADGFHRPKAGGEEYVVRAQVFAGWFGTPMRLRRVLEWLDDEGLLDHSRERTRGRSSEWAQKHATWPDETRVRSINLYLPNGFDDLAHGG